MESRVAEPMRPSLIPLAEVDLLRTANHPRTPSLSGLPATSSMTFLIAPCNLASTETGISTYTHAPSLISFPPSSSLLFSSLVSPLSSLFLFLCCFSSFSVGRGQAHHCQKETSWDWGGGGGCICGLTYLVSDASQFVGEDGVARIPELLGELGSDERQRLLSHLIKLQLKTLTHSLPHSLQQTPNVLIRPCLMIKPLSLSLYLLVVSASPVPIPSLQRKTSVGIGRWGGYEVAFTYKVCGEAYFRRYMSGLDGIAQFLSLCVELIIAKEKFGWDHKAAGKVDVELH